MAQATLDQVIEQADLLSTDEQLRLIAHLAERMRAQPMPAGEPPRLRWRDIRGTLPYLAFGEDAQACISRTRREDTERRERQWRKES